MKVIEVEVPQKIKDYGIDASGLGFAIIIVGGIAFLVGCLGLLTSKCMKAIFACPFCFLGFIIGFVMLFVGLAGTGQTQFYDGIVLAVCTS